MPFFPRTEREIVNEHLTELNTRTNITQLAPGGKARFFLSTSGREQAKQHRLFDANLLQPYIKYANGQFLDFFGDMLKVPRLQSSHAESAGNNFMFYVDSGAFGDINGGVSFTIPAGTTAHTSSFEGDIVTPGIEAQPVIAHNTTQNAVCHANSAYVYVPVRAAVEGVEGSVPRNVLSSHDFTKATISDISLLKCTNRYAIDNGINRETDTSYRFRLQNIFRSRYMAVMASIRLTALAVPGVSNIVMVNAEQGPGSYAVFIKGVTPTVSPEILEEISTSIALVTGYGIRPFVTAPRALGLEFVVAVNWSSRASAEQIAQGYVQMRDALEARLNDTEIGEEILFPELIDILLAASPYAVRIGRNVINKFEEAYVHRPDAENVTTVKSLIIGETITPLYNERVLLETANRYRGIRFITF